MAQQPPSLWTRVQHEAATSWLKPQDIYAVLADIDCCRRMAQREVAFLPPHGSLLVYPAQGLRYRTDGYNWARKPSGRLKESNSTLSVHGNQILTTYTRDQRQVMCRRIYRLRSAPFVLVHYLADRGATGSIASPQSTPLSICNAQSTAVGTGAGPDPFGAGPHPDALPWDSPLGDADQDEALGPVGGPPASSSPFPAWAQQSPPASVNHGLDGDDPLSLLVADFSRPSSPPRPGATDQTARASAAPAVVPSPAVPTPGAEGWTQHPASRPQTTPPPPPPPPPPGPTRAPSTPGAGGAADEAPTPGPHSLLVAPAWAPCQGGDSLLLCLPRAGVDAVAPRLLSGESAFLCEFEPVATVPARLVGPASFQCRAPATTERGAGIVCLRLLCVPPGEPAHPRQATVELGRTSFSFRDVLVVPRVPDTGAEPPELPDLKRARGSRQALAAPATVADPARRGSKRVAPGSPGGAGAAGGTLGLDGAREEDTTPPLLDDAALAGLEDSEIDAMGEELARRLVRQLAALATENEELRGEVDALDEQGLALLHYAALCALPRLVPELARHGADLDLRTGSGLSPLHIAAHVGAADVARALVVAGASPCSGDAQGFTPSQRAAAAGHLDLAHHLFLAANAYRQTSLTSVGTAAAAAVMAMSNATPAPSPAQSTPPTHQGPPATGGSSGGMGLAPWTLQPSASSPAQGQLDNSYIPGTPGSGPLTSSYDGATTPSAGSTPCDGYSATHSLTGEEEDMGREMLERAFASMSLHEKCALSLGVGSTRRPVQRRRSSSGVSTPWGADEGRLPAGSGGQFNGEEGEEEEGEEGAVVEEEEEDEGHWAAGHQFQRDGARWDQLQASGADEREGAPASEARAAPLGGRSRSAHDAGSQTPNQRAGAHSNGGRSAEPPRRRRSGSSGAEAGAATALLAQGAVGAGSDKAWVRNVLGQSTPALQQAMDLMSEGELTELEAEARLIQSSVRTWLVRRNYKTLRDATRVLQGAAKAFLARRRFARHRAATRTIQAATRRMLARRELTQARQASLRIQTATRGMLARKQYATMRRQLSATLIIQRSVRQWLMEPGGGS